MAKLKSTQVFGSLTVDGNISSEYLNDSIKYYKSTNSGNALTIPVASLEDGKSYKFISSVNTNGACTINGKALRKAGTSSSVTNLKLNKPYEVMWSASDNCFFLVAKAEGNAVAGQVLAGTTFSNDDDTGISGTMPNRVSEFHSAAVNMVLGTASPTPGRNLFLSPPEGYYNGGNWTYVSAATCVPENIKKDVTMFGITGTYKGREVINNTMTLERSLFFGGSGYIGTYAKSSNGLYALIIGNSSPYTMELYNTVTGALISSGSALAENAGYGQRPWKAVVVNDDGSFYCFYNQGSNYYAKLAKFSSSCGLLKTWTFSPQRADNAPQITSVEEFGNIAVASFSETSTHDYYICGFNLSTGATGLKKYITSTSYAMKRLDNANEIFIYSNYSRYVLSVDSALNLPTIVTVASGTFYSVFYRDYAIKDLDIYNYKTGSKVRGTGFTRGTIRSNNTIAMYYLQNPIINYDDNAFSKLISNKADIFNNVMEDYIIDIKSACPRNVEGWASPSNTNENNYIIVQPQGYQKQLKIYKVNEIAI